MAFAAGGAKQISRQSTEPARQKTKNFPAPKPLPFPSAGRRGKTVNAKKLRRKADGGEAAPRAQFRRTPKEWAKLRAKKRILRVSKKIPARHSDANANKNERRPHRISHKKFLAQETKKSLQAPAELYRPGSKRKRGRKRQGDGIGEIVNQQPRGDGGGVKFAPENKRLAV